MRQAQEKAKQFQQSIDITTKLKNKHELVQSQLKEIFNREIQLVRFLNWFFFLNGVFLEHVMEEFIQASMFS